MNVAEHEKALLQLNQRILNGEKVDVDIEISRLLGETNLAYKLRDRLNAQVSGEISAKAREHLTPQQYFNKYFEIEGDIIQSNFSYSFFQEVTLEEIEALDPTLLDSKTLMLILISALKGYVDAEQEADPKCEMLHAIYLILNKQLSTKIPDYPEGDGFYEYLNERENRAKHEELKQSGKGCPYCNSSHVQHYGANKFKCASCNRYWRTK